MTRGLMLGATALTGALALMASPAAAQDRSYDFDIPAQPLETALRQYSRTTSQQLIFADADVRGHSAPALAGTHSAEEALGVLLAGTDLKVRRTAQGVLQVAADTDPQSSGAAGDGADGTVEALIVTAQKREEDIQDVPIAISAFTQEALERSQIAGGPDLMTQVPNMTFTKTNFSSYSIQIRGIGTQAISATTDAAVAVAFNNSSLIRNRFFEQEFYDLQRVEVLRGPQGTLYGRNATAGVVNLISEKPKFLYEAKLSADVANYSSSRVEGMINIPLAEDAAALRLAGAWTKRDGYAFNEITGQPIDGRDLWSTRLSLRLAPTDSLDVNLIWEHFEEDDDRLRSGKQLCNRHLPEMIGGREIPYGSPPPGSNNGFLYEEFFSQGCQVASLYSPDSLEAPVGLRLPYYRALNRLALPIQITGPDGAPFDPYASTTQSHDLRVIESTVNPRYKAKTDVFELQASFEVLDNLTLTSETAYVADRVFSTQDYNRFNTRPGAFIPNPTYVAAGVLSEDGVFCDPQIGCADRLVAVDLSTADSRQFSQEIRISSDYDGPFNFSLGANYLRYDTEDKYYVFINTLSLYAIGRAISQTNVPDIYEPGVTDNIGCLERGLQPPDVDGIEVVTNCVYMDPNPIESLNDQGHNYFLSRNPYKLISYAAFGEAYYNITDNLKLTAGVRWTVDKKEAPRIPSWVLAANTVGYPVAETIEQEWREPTGRLTLDWKPELGFTDDTLLYASFARGYKAGGANPPASGLVLYNVNFGLSADWGIRAAQEAATAPRRFDPEFVNAFELGAKNTLMGGALTLNLAGFYYDYEGYQISQIINRSAINLNFDADVWGLELEADWRPLENLRLAFKGGYENTRMADGSRAVDVMDRANGGAPDANGLRWFVTAPFPSLPSNCILPEYTILQSDGDVAVIGTAGGGGLGPCEMAYVLGLDPLTWEPYRPFPFQGPGAAPCPLAGLCYEDYPGFDPRTAPNGGAGFYKDLSGNELPNAPHFTATLSADYTLPLPNDWLATLHTDLYYQSEAWTRVFNTEGYDKLKAYTNVNLAAIFTNEDAGWKVMAYVKNVFDRDSITGAFLNSDDTGLTTNVFLTEPRLYGLRVTKDFAGGPWWTGGNLNHTGPFPLTIELGGQVQRHDAPSQFLRTDWVDDLPGPIALENVQDRDLDWGDGRSVKLTYRPGQSSWSVSGTVRYGRTNKETSQAITQDTALINACKFSPAEFLYITCDPDFTYGGVSYYYERFANVQTVSWSDAAANGREEHLLVDFAVGHDVGLGDGLQSTVSAGLRHAEFQSDSHWAANAQSDWVVSDGWGSTSDPTLSSNRRRHIVLDAEREFEGVGPTLAWEGDFGLLGGEQSGRLTLDWSAMTGVLFGSREVTISGEDRAVLHEGIPPSDATPEFSFFTSPLPVVDTDITPIRISRSDDVTAPMLDLTLGLSYEVGRIKVGAGYRWERYFDVIDGGYEEAQDVDRTIDGPYFKLAVGFGG